MLAWLATGLIVCGLSLACGPTPAAPPTPNPDAFAVVRATAQAAYQAGQTAIARGDYLQACVDLDAAKTNDPDNRPEIQQALEQALARCLTPAAESTSAPAAAPQRTLAVATIAAGVSTALAPTAAPGAVQTVPASTSASPVVATSTVAAEANTPGSTAATAAIATLNMWNDPQGRFSIGAPAGWNRVDQPQALIGAGAVEFQDPSGHAELDVAVDGNARAVSPELYAASLELAMQRQVPGYASEQIVPATTAGSPSVRRVFTFTQRDAAGQDHQARGFQLAIVKGSTPYLISASAPAEQFDQFSPTFDQMVQSFRFS